MTARNPRSSTEWHALALSLAVAALACGTEGQGGRTPGGGEPSTICPTCEPLAGGETGDFGGTPTPCSWVSARVEITRAEALGLGFDVPALEQRLQRPFDLPLRWEVRPTDAGLPASGYEPETRVRGALKVTSYAHWRPDPAYCDGTTCRREQTEMAQNSCGDSLDVAVELELTVLDGSLRARATGEAWQRRTSSSEGAAVSEVLQLYAKADLRGVTGSLVLAPDPSSGLQRGELAIEAVLKADQLAGTLYPRVLFDGMPWPWYDPLQGTFPPRDPPGPNVGGPKPSADAGPK